MTPQFTIDTNTIASWFSLIRLAPSVDRDRLLECFWDTQLDAKVWLTNELQKIVSDKHNVVYIFGGWYGILASILSQSTIDIESIYSVDIDANCERGHLVFGDTVKFITSDMGRYIYSWDNPPSIVVNTSCEHVEQSVYNEWYDRIPTHTIIVAQSNNFYRCSEHIRCSANIKSFMIDNHIVSPLYIGELENTQYTRYMAIWRK